MYKNYRIALVIPAFYEGEKTALVVEKVPGEVVDEIEIENENEKLKKEDKKPAIGERILLGFT